VRLPVELVVATDRATKAENTSRSVVIREALTEHLKAKGYLKGWPMLSEDARRVAGVLIIQGYTPGHGLTLEHLRRDYLPDMAADLVVSAVQDLERQGLVRVIPGKDGQPGSVDPTPKLRSSDWQNASQQPTNDRWQEDQRRRCDIATVVPPFNAAGERRCRASGW
jgi:Ribbon-helix-helix protein, copG family